MKKQLSLWLVSLYAEFIALLLNSFLGLLFWPSLKRGGERSVTFFPATLKVVSLFSMCLEGLRQGILGPLKRFLASSWLRALLACFVGFGPSFIQKGTFSSNFSQSTRREGIELPTTSFTVKLSTTGYLLAQWSSYNFIFTNQLMVF